MEYTPKLKGNYDIVIVGAGVHGLGLACNLAQMGYQRVAVLDSGYVGGGASGRNTALIRAAFSIPEWILFFKESERLWARVSQQLEYNVMFSARGYIVAAASEQEAPLLEEMVRTENGLGVKTRLISARQMHDHIPLLDESSVTQGVLDPNGGTARHDALVWGYKREAMRLGVDVLPFTTVTGLEVRGNEVRSVTTNKGRIELNTLVNAAGGHSPDICAMAGLKVGTRTYRLEALVTESYKPFQGPVFVCPSAFAGCCQTDRGELVAFAEEIEPPTYSVRSSVNFLRRAATTLLRFFPALKLARIQRQWAGIIDISEDNSPTLGEVEEVKDLILDCGWGGYGFMAAPACNYLLAKYLVTGVKPALLKPFNAARFKEGKRITDKALAVAYPPDQSENVHLA